MVRAMALQARAAPEQEAEQQRREGGGLRSGEDRERERRAGLELAPGQRALDHDDEPERDERLGEEVAPVGQQVRAEHGAGGDEQRRRRVGAPSRRPSRNSAAASAPPTSGMSDAAAAASTRSTRPVSAPIGWASATGIDRQQRQQQPVLRVVRRAVVARHAELGRHRQRGVMDDRLRDGEHRAAVEDRDLRLADEQQKQGDGAAQADRDAAVVARRNHGGESTQAVSRPSGPVAMGRIGVSFLIPAYNEAARIGEVLTRVDALGLDAQIVVVDDGSTDGTAARRRGVHGRAPVRRAAAPAQPRQGLGGAAGDHPDRPRDRGHPGRRHGVRPGRRRRADQADRGRHRRRRLRLAAERRGAAARVHVLASDGQPLPVAADRRAVQHDALGHGDRLQGVSLRRAACRCA